MGWDVEAERSESDFLAMTDAEKDALRFEDVGAFIAPDTLELEQYMWAKQSATSPRSLLERFFFGNRFASETSTNDSKGEQ
jgi:hypothetical protein